MKRFSEYIELSQDDRDDTVAVAVLYFPHLLDSMDFSHLSKNIQEKIIKGNPSLINRIKNLHPELAKQYKTSLLGSEAGFY